MKKVKLANGDFFTVDDKSNIQAIYKKLPEKPKGKIPFKTKAAIVLLALFFPAIGLGIIRVLNNKIATHEKSI